MQYILELFFVHRLEDLQTCAELVAKHGQALQRSLNELEQSDEIALKTKSVTERTTLFRIASTAMINVSYPLKIENSLLLFSCFSF